MRGEIQNNSISKTEAEILMRAFILYYTER